MPRNTHATYQKFWRTHMINESSTQAQAVPGHKEYGNLPQEELIEKVHEIANDPKWWKAQWNAYISTYWEPALKLLKSKGYTKALTIGAVMDTAMNAGMGDDDSQHWG